jgi:hypothetical protein
MDDIVELFFWLQERKEKHKKQKKNKGITP